VGRRWWSLRLVLHALRMRASLFAVMLFHVSYFSQKHVRTCLHRFLPHFLPHKHLHSSTTVNTVKASIMASLDSSATNNTAIAYLGVASRGLSSGPSSWIILGLHVVGSLFAFYSGQAKKITASKMACRIAKLDYSITAWSSFIETLEHDILQLLWELDQTSHVLRKRLLVSAREQATSLVQAQRTIANERAMKVQFECLRTQLIFFEVSTSTSTDPSLRSRTSSRTTQPFHALPRSSPTSRKLSSSSKTHPTQTQLLRRRPRQSR